jgi:hypothetical protein
MKPFAKIVAAFIKGILVIILSLSSCSKGNLPGVPLFKVLPSIGDTSLVFEFDAGESSDDCSYAPGLQFRWDIDGDGAWDTEYSNNCAIAHRFNQPGTFKVAIEVKDPDDLAAIGRDSVIVFGENPDIDTLYDRRDGKRYRISPALYRP